MGVIIIKKYQLICLQSCKSLSKTNVNFGRISFITCSAKDRHFSEKCLVQPVDKAEDFESSGTEEKKTAKQGIIKSSCPLFEARKAIKFTNERRS